ncbi:MAG: winged helix-turn-helix domain-containing protein [Methanobrevibacter ruminantium]|uniref:winged helix-turn-helix domain-containing protein n=1 Tax=Methanobrevibacter ruminantium TaxID=83816 RepID=UPI0026EC71D2|nr:winged helix-turn-helix domain-containing protein [Methanobrevibacter ruminantium]MCI5737713.1 winged helix-turn-helix domain-containing protein [Methanobrevibacter ruminantium]
MKDSEKIIIELIKLSKNREKIFKALDGETLKPTNISKKTNIPSNNVSRILSQLREKNLVRLLNPETKRGRLYELTDYGKEILDLMKSQLRFLKFRKKNN